MRPWLTTLILAETLRSRLLVHVVGAHFMPVIAICLLKLQERNSHRNILFMTKFSHHNTTVYNDHWSQISGLLAYDWTLN